MYGRYVLDNFGELVRILHPIGILWHAHHLRQDVLLMQETFTNNL